MVSAMRGSALTRNFEKGTLVLTLSVEVESEREDLFHIILTTEGVHHDWFIGCYHSRISHCQTGLIKAEK